MVEEIRHPDGRIEHPSVRYERTDADLRPILMLLIGAIVFAAASSVVLLVFFHEYRNYQNDIKKSPYPLAPTPSTSLPPQPRLEQVDRVTGYENPDAYEKQASSEKVLSSYGPTGEAGFVHIPIGQAMKLVEKELAARKQQPAEQRRRDGGLVDAGEPNSGRLFREKP
jgi:hypothetical protein